MVTGGIQFLHIETYGLVPPKKRANGNSNKWSVRDILAEVGREPQACLHIRSPSPPSLLRGPSLADLEVEIGAIHARSTDAVGRKLRKDASVLLAGVASYPRGVVGYEYWKRSVLEWLQARFAENLRTVVQHCDEAHPHVHFFVVNAAGGNVKDLHPGYLAGRNTKTPKEQRIAYNSAMRQFQDDFWESVGGPAGLARLGPKRRRLSRAQWTREKFGLASQALVLQRANEIVRGDGERERRFWAFVDKAKLEAQALLRELDAREAAVLALEAKHGLSGADPS